MRPLCGIKTIQGAAELTVFSAVLPVFVYCINILIQGQMFNSMSESGGTVYTLMAVVTTGGIVLLWIAVRTLKKCFVICFPVACGHRRCTFSGRSSKLLREIILSVDEAIPTEQQLEELKSNSLRYLIDVKSALEKSWTPNYYYFFSGSAVEGFGIPLMMSRQKVCLGSASKSALHADLDVMFCCSEVKASFSGQENILVEPLVSESEGFTGYVQLISFTSSVETRFVSSNLNRLRARDAVQNTPVVNLPGTTCCCGRINDTPKLKLHSRGPSMKLRIAPLFEADFTVCIHCPEWPTMSDWSSRPRHWPSTDEAQRIMSLGCHLVAKPAPSDKAKTSWRFSFSLAEVELSKLVPAMARKCFLALKFILKDHLQPVVPEISFYHIKTIFLNTLEKVPLGFWVEDNIEECFLTLLTELHDTLSFRNCPHHWFSYVNLFDSRGSYFCTNAKSLQILAKKVERILRDPAPFIFDDGCCCLSPCCFRLPQNNFTRRSSEQLLAEYGEVAFSVDGHVFTQPHDPAYHLPIYSSPRSEAQLHHSGHCRGADEEGIPAEPDNVVVSLPSRHLTEEEEEELTYYTGVAEDQEFLVPVQDV